MSTVGRYRLEEVLGAGGMGVVHAAHDPRLDRRVAVKVMSATVARTPEFRARFDREATIVARLDSPHVVEVYDHGEQDGTPYLVTRLVPGGDLASLVRARGPMPPRTAASIGAQVAEALRDAHAAGVVHRDVKAANVLLADPDAAEPYAYLCDFGIATASEVGGDLTRTGAGAAGTWSHLAPERFDGAPGTPASDLYALGCLLHVCLTGRPPYTGGDLEVAEAHHVAPVPRLGGTDAASADLDRLLSALLAKDPADRPRDADVVRTHLRAVAAGDRAAPLPTGRPPRRPRRGVVLTGAALLVAAAAAVPVVLVGLRADAPAPGDPGTENAEGGAAAPELVTADMDGDGYGDLLVQIGRGRDASQLVYRSDGTRLAEEPVLSDAGFGASVAGDVDGDGRLDVVSTTFGQQWLARTELGSGETSRRRLDGVSRDLVESENGLPDLDGDGRADLAVVGPDEDGAIIVLGSASRPGGTRGPLRRLALPADVLAPVFWGDYDGDGLDDLLQVRADPSRPGEVEARVLANDGEGSFSSRGRVPLPAVGPRDRGTAADVDGDGADELLVQVERGSGDGTRSWRLVDPVEGTVEVLSTVPQPADPADVLVPVVADLDGDGADDVAVLRREGDTFRVDVQLATGEALAPPETWGVVRCGDRCDDLTLLRAY